MFWDTQRGNVMVTRRARLILTLLCALLALSGCGGGAGKPVPVEGKVTLDGEPIADVTLVFTPTDGKGQRAHGKSGSDGTFRLTTRNTGDGALPGSYKVTVRKDSSSTLGDSGMADTKGADYLNKMKDMTKTKQRPPTKPGKSDLHSNYGDEKSTPLQYEIPAGGNRSLKVELSKGGT